MKLNKFIIESHLNKINDDSDYERKDTELIAMLSTPLSFNYKEYRFDINSQFSGNNRTI
jgi:hypothetical protein